MTPFGHIWGYMGQIPPNTAIYRGNSGIWAIFGGIWAKYRYLGHIWGYMAGYGPIGRIWAKYRYFTEIPLFRPNTAISAISAKYRYLGQICPFEPYTGIYGQLGPNMGKSPTTASIELVGAKRGDSGDIPYFTLFGDSGQIWWCTPNIMI